MAKKISWCGKLYGGFQYVPNHVAFNSQLAFGCFTEYPRGESAPENDIVKNTNLITKLSRINGVLNVKRTDCRFQPFEIDDHTLDKPELGSGVQCQNANYLMFMTTPKPEGVNAERILRKSYTTLGLGNQSINMNGTAALRSKALDQDAAHYGLYSRHPIETVEDYHFNKHKALSDKMGHVDPNDKFVPLLDAIAQKTKDGPMVKTYEYVMRRNTSQFMDENGQIKRITTMSGSTDTVVRTATDFFIDIAKQKAVIKDEKRQEIPRNICGAPMATMDEQKVAEDAVKDVTNCPTFTGNKSNQTIFAEAEAAMANTKRVQPVIRLDKVTGEVDKLEPTTICLSGDMKRYNTSIINSELGRAMAIMTYNQPKVFAEIVASCLATMKRRSYKCEIHLKREGYQLIVPVGDVVGSIVRMLKTVQQKGEQYLEECFIAARGREIKGTQKFKSRYVIKWTNFDDSFPIVLDNIHRIEFFLSLGPHMVRRDAILDNRRMGMGNYNGDANFAQSMWFELIIWMINQFMPNFHDVSRLFEKLKEEAMDDDLSPFYDETNPLSSVRGIARMNADPYDPTDCLMRYTSAELWEFPEEEYQELNKKYRVTLHGNPIELLMDCGEVRRGYKIPRFQIVAQTISFHQKSDDQFVVMIAYGLYSRYILGWCLALQSIPNRKISVDKSRGCKGLAGDLYSRWIDINHVFVEPAGNKIRAIYTRGTSILVAFSAVLQTALEVIALGDVSMGISMLKTGMLLARQKMRVVGVTNPLYYVDERSTTIRDIFSKYTQLDNVPVVYGGPMPFSGIYFGVNLIAVMLSVSEEQTHALFLARPLEADTVDILSRGSVIEEVLLEKTTIASATNVYAFKNKEVRGTLASLCETGLAVQKILSSLSLLSKGSTPKEILSGFDTPEARACSDRFEALMQKANLQ